MSERSEEIERFIEYFRDQKTKIEIIQPLAYRKILYATALDPLARAAFGTASSHRSRILRLLSDVTHWEHGRKVSLPQLCIALKEDGLASSDLYLAAREKLQRWPKGHVLRLDQSPNLDELVSDAQDERAGKVLAACQYQELFYTYRNNLVHEFREPGYGMEMSDDGSSPYYHSMSLEKRGMSWELVFPVGFFSWVYSESVEGLLEYLAKEGIDPYSNFEFGTRWRAK